MMTKNTLYITARLLTFLLFLITGVSGAWAEKGYPVVTMNYIYVNNGQTIASDVVGWGESAWAGYNYEGNRDNYPFVEIQGSYGYITFIKVDATQGSNNSSIPTGNIISATLHAKVSGSLDNQRPTSWVVDYNNEENLPNAGSAWGARHFIGALRSSASSTSTNSETYNDVTFDITAAIQNDADRKVVLVVFETAEGGGNIKEPWVEITTYDGWTVSEYTVDLTFVDYQNKISSGMPTLRDGNNNDITNSNGVTFSYTGAVVGNGFTAYPPRLKATGDGTVTATVGDNTYTYNLHVTGTTVSGTYDAANNKYTFDRVGIINDRTFTQVEGVTMSITGGPTALVVNAEGTTALKVIDVNGYSQPNLTGGIVPPDDNYGGTFYKFVPEVNGHIYFEGNFQAAVWIKDGVVIKDNAYSTKDFEVVANSTYILYNPGNASAGTVVPLLHSYRFEQEVQIVTFDGGNGTVSKALGDTPFTKTATSNKGGTITYSSSDPSVATVDENGQVTIHHAGVSVITATAAPINGITSASASYLLEVNVQKKWIFDDALGANWTTTSWTTANLVNQEMSGVPETAGLLFDNVTYTGNKPGRLIVNVGQNIQLNWDVVMTIPNLHRGQVVQLALASAGGTATASITNVSNMSNRVAQTSLASATTGTNYDLVVENDGDVVIRATSNNFQVRAIYVYNLGEATTGEIHYNGDLPMIEKETATPHNIFFYDSNNEPLSSNLFGELYGFTSDNPSLLTVDAYTGEVTVPEGYWLEGTATITCYAKSLDAIKYQDATLTRTITIQSSYYTKSRSKNILINDLYYLPMASSADGGLDRTIPYVNLTLTGGNNLMSSSDGSMLTMNGGNIKITPRYKSDRDATKYVYITHAVAYFSDGTAQTVTVTGNQEEVNMSFHEKEITSIMVKYRCSDSDVDPDNLLDASKRKPGLSFSSTSSEIGLGSIVPVIQVTSGHKNLRGITYSITNNGYAELTNGGETLHGTALGGPETLTAQFIGNGVYYSSSNAVTHYVYVVQASGLTASIEISNRLDVDAYCGYDGFAFVNEALTVVPSIKDANGNPVDISNYDITYTTSDVNMAYADAQGGITTGNTSGQVYIAATFTPKTTGEVLSTSYQLGVLSGWWDIRTYNQTNGHNQLGENDGWTGESTGLRRDRDVPDFRFIIRTDDTPLAQTIALQTRKRMRFIYDSRNQVSGGQLHLFGRGVGDNESPNGGGEVRVPVRAGMLIEIFARTNSIHSEMNISGTLDSYDVPAVTDLEGNDVTEIFIDETYASYYFIAKNDGIIYIKNPSVNLDFYIGYIKVTDQMVFEYGEETYVDSNDLTNRQFNNHIINQGSTTMTYAWEPIVTNDLCQNLSADGTITFREAAYGSMRVFATGSGGGPLDGKSGSYVVHVVGMTIDDHVSYVVGSDPLTFSPKDQITNISTAAGLSGTELKDKVEFSIVETSPSNLNAYIYGSVGSQRLVIEGAGTVVVKAKLGAIEKLITYTIAGGRLTNISQVIRKDKPSHTITVEGSGISNVQFDWNRMKQDAQGEIKDFVSQLTETHSGGSITISGFDNIQKGGAIPIYATYTYGGANYTLEGMLTVAYTSHVWNFEHDLTYEIKDWTPLYGAWITSAKYEKPDDSDTYRDDSKDWRYVRKIGGHTDVSIVYYYNHTSQGQNASVIPTTAGLVINSTKDGHQLGIEMNTTAAHLADLSTGKYVCQNLMILRGGQFIVPKVKPGQWIELRWTRHKEDMAERFSMQNLLDAEGKYIDKIYKIGNCFYNIPGNTSTYMFQVAGPDDDPSVTLDEDGCVNAVFTVDDNIYISIQQIELHEPGWDYDSSMAQRLKARIDGNAAVLIDPHFVCDGEEHTIELLSKDNQNAPNAPQQWEISFDGTLEANGATKEDGWNTTASFTYQGGWGKVYVTLNSYTQDSNHRYLANRNTWIITIGAQPQQTYPYTWDFSKYFTTTKASVGGSPDDYYLEDPTYTDRTVPNTVEDMTSYIDNPNMDNNSSAGWTTNKYYGGNGPLTPSDGEKPNALEYWAYDGTNRSLASFDYYQDITGLPAGKYVVTADMLNSLDNEANSYFSATCGLYAECGGNDVHTLVDIEGRNYFSYSTPVIEVGSGQTLRIGVKNFSTPMSARWFVADNFKLSLIHYDGSSTRSHEYRKDIDTWTETGNIEDVITTDYDSRKYWSYYVDGAQLVSRTLGILPETEGLGFSLNSKLTGGLALDMQNTVDGTPVTGTDVEFPYTWRDGKLSITGGGTIIVPKPGANYGDYYIYIRSNVAPSDVTNAAVSTDVYPNDVNNDIHQYRYRFTSNEDAVIAFSGAAEVYQIGVTNIHKTMHTVGGVGWATESRDHTIDHALTGQLTVNDANAYTVRYDSYDMETATVSLTPVDEDGYVSATTGSALHGIVLRQDNGATDGTYSVPLFYPAVTTTISSTPTVYNSAAGNMMYPNLMEAQHYQEERDGCTKFILTNVHWKYEVESSWSKSDDDYIENRVGSWQAHGSPTLADAAGFYRLHIWENAADNTMVANTAYLLVPSDRLPVALWASGVSSGARVYNNSIGIREIGYDTTGMDGLQPNMSLEEMVQDNANDAWYTISGMKLDAPPTQPGLYIRGKKKVMVK